MFFQIHESVDEANNQEGDEVVHDLEITSKHNPEPLTPTASLKRIAPDGSSESTTFQETCDGELSSTKLKKHIKTETK